MSKGDLSLYTDTLIVSTIISNTSLTKVADVESILSGASSMIKDYVSSHIDPNDKVGSVINMLTPGVISSLFKAFGFGKLGLLLGLVASTLHIDVGSMVETLWKEVKNTLSSGQKVTPAQIDAAVSTAVQQHAPNDQAPADTSLASDLREARILRFAVEQYECQMLQLTKEASPIIIYAAGRATKTTNVIGRILGWIFKTVLMSAGLLVAGDMTAKMLGMPSALDHTYQAGQTPNSSVSAPTPTTTQTKFKPTGTGIESAPQPWTEQVTNNPGSIENMLIGFTKQVYSGLDGKENAIRSSPTFQGVRDQIAWYNHTAAGEPIVYIPQLYSSKKALVDHYIDEVAK